MNATAALEQSQTATFLQRPAPSALAISTDTAFIDFDADTPRHITHGYARNGANQKPFLGPNLCYCMISYNISGSMVYLYQIIHY